MSDKSNRTERATGRKLSKARGEGQLPRSREIPSMTVLLALVLVLAAGGSFFARQFAEDFTMLLRSAFDNPSAGLPSATISAAFVHIFFFMLFPVLALLMAAAGVGSVALGGWNFALKTVSLKFNKLNPVDGFKKIANMASVVAVFKNTLIIAGLAWVCWGTIGGRIATIPLLINASIPEIVETVTGTLLAILFRFVLFLILVAGIDYFWQKFKFGKDMKMTKEEVKDEYKELEGDPKVKARIRQKQMQAAYRNMLKQVPRASAVVANPTHFAVALHYDPTESDAPTVLAKGQDFLALRIRSIAEAHGVPVVENKPLAQSLYKNCEVGKSIPVMLYKAVAELIAYLYKQGRWKHKINKN